MFLMPARRLAYVLALGFAAALAAALPFNGSATQFLAVAVGLVVAMFAVTLGRGYEDGFVLPRSFLALALSLFWIWIGLTYFWSKVPYATAVNFWWVGSFVLVFWFYQFLPDPTRFWRAAALLTLLIALALAVMALYQLVFLKVEPRATFLNRHSLAAFLGMAALVTCAYFLVSPANGAAISRRPWLLGGALFVLFFVFFLLRGRGATLSVLAGLMLLLGVAWRRVEIRRIVMLLGLVAGAFVLANMLWEGGVIERFASTFNPTVVGKDGRLVIWREAWRMAFDAPWLGIGLGTYWLAWPPYRHPQDGSGGFYVHNDYLQLWIETGVPGLALFIAAFVAVLVLFVRLLRSSRAGASIKVETAGLFSGLFAMAAHSFVDFNFYTLPILLLTGLVLGRFQELCMAGNKEAVLVRPSRWLRKRIYRALILAGAAVPLTYFSTLGVSVHFTNAAKAAQQQGQLSHADTAFRRAELLMPSVDVAFLLHTEMLYQAIRVLPVTEAQHRSTLYQQAMELLNEAEQSNNLRPQLYFLRGELYQVAPEPVPAERVGQAYRTALARDPRFHPARVAAAQLFLKQGDRKAARQLLEEGMNYWYPPSAHQVLPFYELTLKLVREDGDDRLARDLAGRMEGIYQRPDSAGVEPASGALLPIPSARSAPG